LVDFSEADIKPQYEEIMANLGVSFEKDINKFDDFMEFLNLITMMYIASQNATEED